MTNTEKPKLTKTNWQVLGETGPHEDHHLRADSDYGDVYCYECARFLEDEEYEIAWPIKTWPKTPDTRRPYAQ
jgi:hypothetical protein